MCWTCFLLYLQTTKRDRCHSSLCYFLLFMCPSCFFSLYRCIFIQVPFSLFVRPSVGQCYFYPRIIFVYVQWRVYKSLRRTPKIKIFSILWFHLRKKLVSPMGNPGSVTGVSLNFIPLCKYIQVHTKIFLDTRGMTI